MSKVSEDCTRSANTRRSIVQAAVHLYREIGHRKTTVADIARSSSMSSANVYRFFSSKQAIEEAVVGELLDEITRAAAGAAHIGGPPLTRLAASLQAMAELKEDRLAKDQRLHELLALAARENWPIFLSHADRIRGILRPIIAAGQASGELQGGSPMAVTCCLLEAMEAYLSPSWTSVAKLRPSFDEMMSFCAAALRHAPAAQTIHAASEVRLRAVGQR
jgi:AcrR family transcriptional regulator